MQEDIFNHLPFHLIFGSFLGIYNPEAQRENSHMRSSDRSGTKLRNSASLPLILTKITPVKGK